MSDDGVAPDDVREMVADAADVVGDSWPLHSFVTANPLAGFEDRPFHEAVRVGERLYGGQGYPDRETFRDAREDGRIDGDALREELDALGVDADPGDTLDLMEDRRDPADGAEPPAVSSDDRLDRLVSDWLCAFCDEGRAEAPMPGRDEGFYRAWRRLARHDPALPGADAADALPGSPEGMVARALADVPEGRRRDVLVHHLAALPGWTAYVKRRAADGSAWQQAAPIDPTELLAVRLGTAELLGVDAVPDHDPLPEGEAGAPPVEAAWLAAWERTARDRLLDAVTHEAAALHDATTDTEPAGAADAPVDADPATNGGHGDDPAANGGHGDADPATDGGHDDARPDAQLTFCIDTRSEVIRRHVEAQGDYETHGYAGFFGVPIRYDAADEQGTHDACPPPVDAAHRVRDRPAPSADQRAERHDGWRSLVDAAYGLAETLETNVATAFSYVELAGVFYGAVMASLTLVPGRMRAAAGRLSSLAPRRDACYAPRLERTPEEDGDLPAGMTLEERAGYAEDAFRMMGWDGFARLAVFVGHGSETSNNPFDAGLDCGACAGNPGGPNARVLAAICNEGAVRERLAERGIAIPDDTVFLAAEHNTTTDEIEIFDDHVPASHQDALAALKDDLAAARDGAAAERASGMRGVDPEEAADEAATRAVDWAQTRPEWGLAGNAAFVIGPRALTEDLDLGGRSFLHSYEWRRDDDGDALEAILAGPAVVTQWINSQYYFATVDNDVWGSGSKVTQNPTGNLGVRQGNGGDLATGLPLQSIASADDEPYHQPLRLGVVVHAPVERVAEALEAAAELRSLLDEGWLRLSVVDPTRDGAVLHYDEGIEWVAEEGAEVTAPEIAVADD